MIPKSTRSDLIRKWGRFPAFAKSASAGEGRSEKIIRKQSENTAVMNYKIIYAIAAIAGLYSFCSQTVLAAPMRCSGEQIVCISNCSKNPNRAFASNCIANCRVRQSMCMQTGCWDNGNNKYCGLMRQ